MDLRLKDKNAASQKNDFDPDPLHQILNVAAPAIVQTLAFNLKKIDRDNFSQERSTQTIVYRRFASELDVTSRDIVIEAVAQSVRAMNLNPEALITFIENDSSPMIVSKGIRFYLECSLSPLDNPLRPVSDIIELLQDPKTQNKGVILAGLVSFGDRRICAALRPHQEGLTIDTLRQFAVSVRDDRLHKATLDYCLFWLLSLLKQAKTRPELKEHANLVASATIRLILHTSGQVEDRQFHFGCHGFKTYSETSPSTYVELVASVEPLLETIYGFDNPTANKMVELFREHNPDFFGKTERRDTSEPRRQRIERRGPDRRVVDIVPKIERRSENRRILQRRQASRR